MKSKEKRDLIFVVVCIIIIALLCCSCKTKYVMVESVRTDTTYINKTQYDSIWMHDSIYLKEYMKGDTVFLEKTKWQIRYKEKQVHDTLIHERVDSIAVPYPVEKELKWRQRTAIKFFPWVLAGFVGLLGWTFRKPLLTLIRKIILKF